MTLPKGTLVQIKESALDCYINAFHNKEMTDEDGWLWFVDEYYGGPQDLYECKSLATGQLATWFSDELEIPDQSTTLPE
jgi:hypothetical protein